MKRQRVYQTTMLDWLQNGNLMQHLLDAGFDLNKPITRSQSLTEAGMLLFVQSYDDGRPESIYGGVDGYLDRTRERVAVSGDESTENQADAFDSNTGSDLDDFRGCTCDDCNRKNGR